MDDTASRARKTLTPTDSVELLQGLVSIPSPSRQEAKASSWLVEWMAAQGFDAEVDQAGNAVGKRGDGPHQILLLGHIDTFPGELPVRREGDWLQGRGSVDAKGPLCAFAAAAAAGEILPGWQVAVVGAVEEEAATSLGARHVLATWPTPDFCVIGEPSGWDRITTGYKGRLLVDLKWKAPLAHSAGPVVTPAEQAVALWNTVLDYCAEHNTGRDKVFEQLDPSLRHVATHSDGAYGSAEMSLAFRLPVDVDPAALAGELGDLVRAQDVVPDTNTYNGDFGDASKVGKSPFQVDLAFSGGERAFLTRKNTGLVRAFLSGIRAAEGYPRFVRKTGTSDMNVVGPSWGGEIVAYGPGDSAMDHTPQERISLTEYLASIEILKHVLDKLQRGNA